MRETAIHRVGTSVFGRLDARVLACALAVLAVPPAARGQYGETPLRPDLSPEPYFRTEDGRDNKRGADALVNRYRLYDFYRRQADFHLANPTADGAILPPFPGLDGGRRGHWGATNEKETTALPREIPPEFTAVTSRMDAADLYLRQGAGVVVIGTRTPGLVAAYASAELSVPEHAFDLGVDRFGLSLALSGTPAWQGNDNEWTRAGKPLAWYGGYHVHGGRSVIHWRFGKTRLLEMTAMVSPASGLSALLRDYEFLDEDREEMTLALPAPAGTEAGKLHQLAIGRAADGAIVVRYGNGDRAALHRIAASPATGCEVAPDGLSLKLRRVSPGSRLRILSWNGPADGAAKAEIWLARQAVGAPPSQFLAGGPARLGKETVVSGKLDADPEASGTAYEIDDVPLPGEKDTLTPMTLSGLAFADDGAAYACTLVGDVWKIDGLTGDLREVRWKRFAAGLNMPMGMQVVDGIPYVMVRHNVMRLTDLNGDGEADYYERFSKVPIPTGGENGRDLQRDAAGNFYTNNGGGIYRLSADGSRVEKIGGGARNPFGLGVRPDGLAISDSSEGNEENGTCTLFESITPETRNSVAKRNRLLYLPRGIDNSPGSRIFLNEPRFGPLGTAALGVSYGSGAWYSLFRDVVDGTPQAAVVPQPGLFLSGACRLAVQPADGRVFVAGLDGWGDYGVAEGCLHRLRHTGRDSVQVRGWRGCRNGIRIDFTEPLAADPVRAEAIFVQQWNYIDSKQTYGSMEMSVKQPDTPGHDRLQATKATMSPDRKSIFIEIPEILPAMCTQVRTTLRAGGGGKFGLDFYATLQKLAPEPPGTTPAAAGRPVELAVPTLRNNGNTYEKTIAWFDRRAGRELAERAVSADVPYKPGEVNYRWLRANLLEPSCLMCHSAGTQNDFSTWQGLKAKVRTDAPEKSALMGMLQTGSMPPYPLPAVPARMRDAVLDWIRRGAPE